MKETPRNKMITTDQESTKKTPASERQLGVQAKSWYFPAQKRTVVAETLEEAIEIINNGEEVN